MSIWMLFWTIVFALSVALFVGVAVVVTIGGAREIHDLLQNRARRSDDTRSSKT